MAEGIIFGFVQMLITKLGKRLASEMKNQLTHLCCHQLYIQTLTEEVHKLEIKRQTVKQKADVAERNLESIRPDVQDWLTSTDEWLIISKKILDKACSRTNYNTDKNWFLKWLPVVHYSLSVEAQKAVHGAAELQITPDKFDIVSTPLNPANLQLVPPSTSEIFFESRAKLEKQVMEALKDNNVYMIGLCGMGGIGKTTMATKMKIWAKNSKLFEAIISVVVTQKVDIKEVQQQIAESLGLKLEEHSPEIRVQKIHTRLSNEKSFLIVFDDVWENLNLEKIGIPSKCTTNKCKLILTSRNRDALQDLTNEHSKIFILDILPDQEAWKLFREKAGHSIESPIMKIAKQVAKKCKGLPLALVVVGSALKDKDITMWKDALVQLEGSLPRVANDLHTPLKLSYKQLPNEQLKYIFLLCCLFPEDHEIPIESLVRYGWASHVFNNIETMSNARLRVSNLIHILKCQFLLTQGKVQRFFGTGESVRVHDVMREMGISIANEGRYVFMVNQGNWPKKFSSKNISHIYVELNGKQDLPETLNCPGLEFLHIQLYSDVGEIPEEFFSGIKELKVLSACNFKRNLPSSISKLINLHVIHLEDCLLGTMESIFGNMMHLEVISRRGSSLDVLPNEIGQLKNLKVLDLTRCVITIRSGVISKLKKLEELLMVSRYGSWCLEEEAARMVFEEIASLSNLVNLQINIQNQKHLSLNTPFLPKLERFLLEVKVFEGLFSYEVSANKCSLYNKVAFFNCVEVVPMSNFLLSMIRNVECLTMHDNGCIGILNKLGNTIFEGLKYLHLTFLQYAEYLVIPTISSQSQRVLENKSVLFPVLESLTLGDCENLKEICPHQPCIGSFRSLQILDLMHMEVLKHALPISKFDMCSHLEVLKIQFCRSMEHIFMEHEREDHIARAHQNKIIFRRLRSVLLNCLPVDVFCKDIEEIEFPALEKLKIFLLPKMTNFASTNYNINDEQSFLNKKVTCPNLKKLVLLAIRSYEIFNYNIPERCFHQLEHLEIGECNNLKNVMAYFLSRSLKNLKVLMINGCEKLEEVIMLKNSEKDEEVGQGNNIEEILFPQTPENRTLRLTKYAHFLPYFHPHRIAILS